MNAKIIAFVIVAGLTILGVLLGGDYLVLDALALCLLSFIQAKDFFDKGMKGVGILCLVAGVIGGALIAAVCLL